MLDLVDLSVADHDVGLTLDDRLDQVGDAVLGVLIVAVGVDHDVRTELERPDHAIMERAAETLVAGVVHELAHTVFLGYLDRPVAAPVVDDQDHDLVDPGNLLRDRLQDGRKRLLLIEARDLNDELHRGPRQRLGRTDGRC